MATPPKLPASSLTPAAVLWLALPAIVQRDPQGAVRLIEHAGVWDVDACTQVLKILADNPEVRVDRLDDRLYRATEAAELGEAGAMAALIELKLSNNAQFRDLGGACKLV
jgi:hypothetical protein